MSRKKPGRKGTIAPELVRYIRQVAEARRKIPSDDDVAALTGVSLRMVRAIGNGERYKQKWEA